MIDSERSISNSSNIKEPISARLYGGIFVIGFLGFLGFIVNLLIEKYVILGKILSPIILISLLLLSYTWLSVFIYQMTRNRTFVIDFEYAFNQKLDMSSSNNALCSMELKAAMYPPTAKTSNFGSCTTPDNLPEPFLEIEKNKYKEYRYKNRKKSNPPLPNVSLQVDKSK
uniref:Uncharacterized protein n=1 Tax=Strongyloides papillosus TaxID=174720 RepID=A0A0N5BP83_STREA